MFLKVEKETLATKGFYLFHYISSLFKVDLHLALKKPTNVNKNTAYISVNKLPNNSDSKKTAYLTVT